VWPKKARRLLYSHPITPYFQRKGNMPLSPFDILRRHDDGSFIWIEAAQDLNAAQARLRELCASAPGEYFVFDQKSQQIVARLSTRPAAD
jgi:hypothetical protein